MVLFLIFTSNPTEALNHSACRHKVCLICGRKGDRQFSTVHIYFITKHQIQYDKSNDKFPMAICTRLASVSTIFLILTMMRKVAYVFCRCHNCATNISDISNLPTIMDWSQVHVRVNTRNSDPCSCFICEIARKKGRIPKLKRGVGGKNDGKSTTVTFCSKSLSSISRGKNHKCNSTTLRQV